MAQGRGGVGLFRPVTRSNSEGFHFSSRLVGWWLAVRLPATGARLELGGGQCSGGCCGEASAGAGAPVLLVFWPVMLLSD